MFSFGKSFLWRKQNSKKCFIFGAQALCVKPSSFCCWESDVIDELLSQIGKHLTLNILCHAVHIFRNFCSIGQSFLWRNKFSERYNFRLAWGLGVKPPLSAVFCMCVGNIFLRMYISAGRFERRIYVACESGIFVAYSGLLSFFAYRYIILRAYLYLFVMIKGKFMENFLQ